MKAPPTALTLAMLSATALANAVVGQPAPAFSAVDAHGRRVQLADFKGKTVVLEWVNPGCPYVRKHYGALNMQATQKAATAQGVVWLAVNSTTPDHGDYLPPGKMAAWMKDQGAAAPATPPPPPPPPQPRRGGGGPNRCPASRSARRPPAPTAAPSSTPTPAEAAGQGRPRPGRRGAAGPGPAALRVRAVHTLKALGVSSRLSNCTTWPWFRPCSRSTASKGGRSSQAVAITRWISSGLRRGMGLAMRVQSSIWKRSPAWASRRRTSASPIAAPGVHPPPAVAMRGRSSARHSAASVIIFEVAP